MMLREFVTAENLPEQAGLIGADLPIPLGSLVDYLGQDGLKLHYYDPEEAPAPINSIAARVDDVLVYQEECALLFVNESRPLTRLRFSLSHGIGHFVLPGHQNLDNLSRGCMAEKPIRTELYERQADRFADGLNMPPRRFRHQMALMPFGMQTVAKLAKLYSVSLESAAIHYVSLADAPCALIWLERRAGRIVWSGSPLKVRYQVKNGRFPYRIKPGTVIPPGSELCWLSSQDDYSTGGALKGTDLGLESGISLWVDARLNDHTGTVIALLYPGNKEPRTVVNSSKTV